jgi:hypothetical protein
MEVKVTANNPCAVYNFYNCCNGAGSSAADATTSASFIWQSGNVLDPTRATSTATLEPLTPTFNLANAPNAALKAYLGLLPLHRKAQLKEITLIRFAEIASTPAFTASINFDLVVLDFNGVFLRQISTVTLDYRVIPLRTWTPITLSTASGVLDIMPGELIAGQLTFGAALPSSTSMFSAIYQLSGTGVLMP